MSEKSQPQVDVPEATTVDTSSWSITNSLLVIFILYLLFKLSGIKLRKEKKKPEDEYVVPDPLPKHDMTLDELKKYDGTGPDKRICIAILGRVYDVSKGYRFYGPGQAYGMFAGHDATRALAKFDVMAVKEEWDDVSDLTPSEMSSVEEWREQFDERYDYVGHLVRSSEEIIETADTVDETVGDESATKHAPVTKSSSSEMDDDEMEVIDNIESEQAK